MSKFKILLFFIFPTSVISQNITGKIYDSKTTIKGATIYNTTKNQINHTNDNGYFEIEANINDTIIFYSLFHYQKTLIINETHYTEAIVIELKKKINELDEVLLDNTKLKPFDEKKQNMVIKNQIKNDIKKHPYYYNASNGNIGNALNELTKLIGKLFKTKKPKTLPIINITHKEFDTLFSSNTFFNSKLLINDLQIPENYIPLFFDYCEGQDIDNKLLLEENRFLLLDKLYSCSKAFLKILSDYKKHNSKD